MPGELELVAMAVIWQQKMWQSLCPQKPLSLCRQRGSDGSARHNQMTQLQGERQERKAYAGKSLRPLPLPARPQVLVALACKQPDSIGCPLPPHWPAGGRRLTLQLGFPSRANPRPARPPERAPLPPRRRLSPRFPPIHSAPHARHHAGRARARCAHARMRARGGRRRATHRCGLGASAQAAPPSAGTRCWRRR
eukprot:364223-Chlamydomonas_euryale.AAC.1